MSVVDDYELLARTALSKSPKQLTGVISRKIRNRFVHRLPVDFDARYERRIPDGFTFDIGPHGRNLQEIRDVLAEKERRLYRSRVEEFLDGSVSFLNRRREIKNPAKLQPEDPQIEELPRLWYLKLVGFEPLEWVTLGFGDVQSLTGSPNQLDQWVREAAKRHRVGSRLGYLRGYWTPYAVCLRIINLTRYAAWRGGVNQRVQEFLFKNLLFLQNHIEGDVGGNHLIENGAALVSGGLAFRDSGEQFVDRGIEVLQRAVHEQFLADGYHYERSPMYHLAVTERLLSVCSLLSKTERRIPDNLREATAEAHAFVEHLTEPNGVGDIPLLNDSVLGETLSAEACSQYGRDIGFAEKTKPVLDASGLTWLTQNEVSMLVDYGASGPEHLLAHTHNDPFTICVWADGETVLTDTGTFDYQPGKRRQQSRSVQSHNTAHPEGEEPVAFGGRFLMADRLQPVVTHVSDSWDVYHGNYSAGYEHARTVVEGSNWWLVWDSVESNEPIVSHLHSAPGIEVQTDTRFRFINGEQVLLRGTPINADDISVDTTPYFPRFGVENDRKTVTLRTDGEGIGYVLSRQPIDSVSVEANGGTLMEICVDSEQFELPHFNQ
jgi:hypothetical protein